MKDIPAIPTLAQPAASLVLPDQLAQQAAAAVRELDAFSAKVNSRRPHIRFSRPEDVVQELRQRERTIGLPPGAGLRQRQQFQMEDAQQQLNFDMLRPTR